MADIDPERPLEVILLFNQATTAEALREEPLATDNSVIALPFNFREVQCLNYDDDNVLLTAAWVRLINLIN